MKQTKPNQRHYDAILIPGGGIDSDAHLYPWVKARFDAALAHDHETNLYIPLSRGTVYKKQPAIESEVGRAYLISQGVSPHRICIETTSKDTLGNAYFCRTQYTDPQQLARLLIITSAFHMPRTKKLFNWIYNLPPHHVSYQLDFESAPDNSMPTPIKIARVKKEVESLKHLEINLIPAFNHLETLTHWLYTKHLAYIPGSQDTFNIDPTAVDSY